MVICAPHCRMHGQSETYGLYILSPATPAGTFRSPWLQRAGFGNTKQHDQIVPVISAADETSCQRTLVNFSCCGCTCISRNGQNLQALEKSCAAVLTIQGVIKGPHCHIPILIQSETLRGTVQPHLPKWLQWNCCKNSLPLHRAVQTSWISSMHIK